MSPAPQLSVITTERRTGQKDVPANRPPTRAEDMARLNELLRKACASTDRVEDAACTLSDALKHAAG